VQWFPVIHLAPFGAPGRGDGMQEPSAVVGEWVSTEFDNSTASA
jgi:hypothetical protein